MFTLEHFMAEIGCSYSTKQLKNIVHSAKNHLTDLDFGTLLDAAIAKSIALTVDKEAICKM
jgi:hypothetical protein